MTVPNIFSYATSELSQDAAIAYLVAWADERFKASHPKQNALGIDILKTLVGGRAQCLQIENQKIEVGCQCDHVDIWVYIGNQAVLIIEDKTNTSEHGNQIDRYHGIATKWLDPDKQEWGAERVLATYLKTGNESLNAKPKASYINTVDRRDLLRVLNEHGDVSDGIVVQFRSHLQKWEDETLSYACEPVRNGWVWRGIEGFYRDLEDAFRNEGVEVKDWRYVSNAAGGFMAFYWNWQRIHDLKCSLYLQIEHSCVSGNRHATYLRVRVSDAVDDEGTPIRAEAQLRWALLGRLQELNKLEKYSSLKVLKSGTYRPGWTGGVACIDDYVAEGPDGLVDMQATVQNLKLIMELLSEASEAPELVS